MLRKGSVCLFMFGLIALAGCGPSVEEQLKSAEARLDAAEKRLEELDPKVSKLQESVLSERCLEAVGTNLNMLQIEIEAIGEDLKNDKDAIKAMKRSEAVNGKRKRVMDFLERTSKKGSPEFEKFKARMREFEVYRDFEQQREVVKKTKQEVEDLRKQLGS